MGLTSFDYVIGTDYFTVLGIYNIVRIISGTTSIGTTLSWGSSSSCDFQLFL